MNDTPLEHALKRCSFYPLLIVTVKVLSRAGFGDVQILDRRRVSGKSRFGGHEILCEATFGGMPMKVIVKVINDAVRVRMLDELAGAVTRTGADLGMVVSPHHITKHAARNLRDYHGVRLEVLDGKALAGLLVRYGVGVRSRGDVDYAFFGGLEEESTHLIAYLNERL